MSYKCQKCGFENKIEELIDEFPDHKNYILKKVREKNEERKSFHDMVTRSIINRKLDNLWR